MKKNNDSVNSSIINSKTSSINEASHYITQIQRVYSQAPRLKVRIINKTSNQKGTTLFLDPFGMKDDSLRNKRDGYCYFGYGTQNESVDFLITPKPENENDEKFIGRHFYIKFNPFDLKYYIRDVGKGFGTFMKVTGELILKDNSLINIGNSYFVVTFDLNQVCSAQVPNYNESNITIKVFDNDKRDEKTFSCDKERITIGRENNCDVEINDTLLSRIHCTIIYNDVLGWVLKDGKEDILWKNSTNGTWIFLMNETPIEDGIIFKGYHNVYECTYIKEPQI